MTAIAPGQRFTRLVVLDKVGRLWRCRCDCGAETVVPGSRLVSGNTRSCGCLRRELVGNQRRSHAGSGTRLWRCWVSMRKRVRSGAYLVGRGITVCPEWEVFEPFRDWALAHGYADDLMLDRIDNNGSYEPGNCRWADSKTQNRNRRSNKLTLEAVRSIRASSASTAALAQEMSISWALVNNVRKGRIWQE